MASNTIRLSIRKPDPADLMNVTTDLHDGWDTLDGKVDGSAVGDLDLRDTAWTQVVPTWGATGISSSGSLNRFKELVVDDTKFFQGNGAINVGPVVGTITLNLPENVQSGWEANTYMGTATAYDFSTGLAYTGVAYLVTASSNVVGFASGGVAWNATTPFTWTAADAINFDLLYEI